MRQIVAGALPVRRPTPIAIGWNRSQWGQTLPLIFPEIRSVCVHPRELTTWLTSVIRHHYSNLPQIRLECASVAPIRTFSSHHQFGHSDILAKPLPLPVIHPPSDDLRPSRLSSFGNPFSTSSPSCAGVAIVTGGNKACRQAPTTLTHRTE